MQSFVDELITYLNESKERKNKVVSIEGVLAMYKRHLNGVEAHYSPLKRSDDEIVHLNSWRAVEASRGLRTYRAMEEVR